MKKFTRVYFSTLQSPVTPKPKIILNAAVMVRHFKIALSLMLLLVFLVSTTDCHAVTRTTTLSASGPAASNVCTGATATIYTFKAVQSGAANILTGLSFTTPSGVLAATSSELTNFVLLVNGSNTLSGATPLGTITTGTGPGLHSMPSFSYTLANGSTNYFFITADIASGATVGHTVAVNVLTSGNLTLTGAATVNTSGISAGGVQAFVAGPSLSGSTPICPGTTNALTGTPSGGTWASASTSIATVNSSGTVTGVSSGNSVISYTRSGCTSTIVVTVNIAPSAVTITPVSSYTVCLGSSATPTASSTINNTILSQDFNSGMAGAAVGGPWTVVNTGAASPDNWGIVPPTGPGHWTDVTIHGDGTPYAGANADDAGSINLFTSLQSPAFSTVGYSTATLTFNYYCESDDLYDTKAELDYSINGGASWVSTPLYDYLNSTTGTTTWSAAAPTQTISLPSGALGQPNVMLRWFWKTNFGWYWAVDNIVLSGTAAPTYTWTGISGATGISCSACATPTITPTAGGTNVYSVSAAFGTCSTSNGISININNPGPILGNMPLCIGGSPVSLTNSVSGGTWSSSNSAQATVGSTSGIVTGLLPGNPVITYTLPPGCTATATLTVSPSPDLSNFTSPAIGPACVGLPLSVTVNSTTLTPGTYTVTYNLSGANTATGSTATLTMGGAGMGTFSTAAFAATGSTTLLITAITSGSGCVSNPSGGNSVTFIVQSVPLPITGTGSVCQGSTITLNEVTTSGTWSSSNSALAIVGSTGIVSGTGEGIPNISYTLATGCYTTTPVTVNATPNVFTVTGGGSYCPGGTGVHIGLNGSNTGIRYDLKNGASTFTFMAGTGSAIDFGLITPTGTYTVLAVNTVTACSSGMTGTAVVAYSSLPIAYSITGGGAYCASGTGVNIGLNGSEIGRSYQLYIGGSTSVGGSVAGTGLSLNFGLATTPGTYTVKADPGTPCELTMTGTAVVSTTPNPVVYTLTSMGTNYCAGGIGYHVNLSGSDFGINYQLLINSLPSGGPVSGINGALDFGLQTATGTYTVLAVNATTGCSSNMTGSPAITANPRPTPFTVTGGGGYCTGSAAVHVGLANSTTGVNYQLYKDGVSVGPTGVQAGSTGLTRDFGPTPANGVYTVVGANATTGCTATMTGSVTVTVNALPASYLVTGGGNICPGGTGVHIGLNGSAIGTVYQLMYGPAPVGAAVPGTTGPLDFGIFSGIGSYTVMATTAAGCTQVMGGFGTISAITPPSTYPLTGGGNFCVGAPGVDVSISNSDIAVNYQLYRDGIAVGALRAGIGASIDFGLQTVSGNYTVVATSTFTGCTSTSGTDVVTANIPPRAFTVTGGGGYCTGGTGVAIGLNGSVIGTNYQLFNSSGPGPILAGTGAALNFGLITAANGYTVRATTPATTCSSNMTGSVNVIINPLPAAYAITGGGRYCLGGTGINIGLRGSEINTTYKLLKSGSPLGSPLAGTGAALDFGLIATLDPSYTVLATNTNGCVNTMTGSVIVGTNPLPGQNTVTGGGPNCAGGPGMPVGLNGSLPGVRYQLFNNVTPVGAPLNGTSSALTFGLQTANGTYTVVGTDTVTGCSNNMLASATITTNPRPIAYTVLGGGSMCAGDAGVNIGLSNSTVGVRYQLFLGASAFGGSIDGSGGVLNFGPVTTAGTFTMIGANIATGCTNSMFGSATVVVNPTPDVDTVTGGGPYCAGGAGSMIGLNMSTPGVNYQVYNGFFTSGPLVLGTGLPLNFGSRTAAGTYTVIATIAATGCTANMANTAEVSINPLPTLYSVTGGGSYCQDGDGVAIGLSSSQEGVSYRIYLGGSSAGDPVNGTGSAISFGSFTGAGVYTVIASDNTTECTRAMAGSATVTINPLPGTYTVSGGGNYCPGGAGVHVLQNGSDVGINYQLTMDGGPAGSPVAGTGIFIDFGAHTPTGVYGVTATNAVTGCSADMEGTTEIGFYPIPEAHLVSGGGGYCNGGTGVEVSLTSSDEGISYQLFRGAAMAGAAMTGSGDSVHFGMQTAAGTYFVVGTNVTTGCSNNMTGTAVVTINPLPNAYFVTGGGKFCPGGDGVHVGVSGSQTGVSYQMQIAGVDVGDPLTGTGASLDFGLQTDLGDHMVVATNTTTNCTGNMTGAANVSNFPAPAPFAVVGTGRYCTGSTGLPVSLGGSQAGVMYQLYMDGVATGSPVAGTGGILNFGIHTAATYTIIATSTSTLCTSNMPGSAVITMDALPAVYTLLSSSSSYCEGGAGVDIYIDGTQMGVNYQLYHAGSTVGAPVLGSGGPVSFGMQAATGSYTMVAIDSMTGCRSDMAGSPLIYTNPLPAISSVTGGGAYCMGGTGVHVGLDNSVSAVAYELYVNGSSTGTVVRGTGTGIDLGLQTTLGSYTVVATNTVTACSSNMSGSATVSALPQPIRFNMIGGGGYCDGGTGVPVGLSNTEASGTSYQLFNGPTPVGLPMPGTTGPISFGLQTDGGIYHVVATNNTTGCSINTATVAVVTINALPDVYTVTGGGNYCAGGDGLNIGLSGSHIRVSYQLYRAGIPVGSPVLGTGSALSFGLQTTTGAYTVMATDTIYRCVNNMAGAASVGINPLPAVYAVIGGGNYCTGGTGVHVGLANSDAGIQYQLNGPSGPVGGPVTGSGSPIDFGLITGAGAYTVVAANTATGCTNNMSGSATVLINIPVTPIVTVASSMGDALCAGVLNTFTAIPVHGGASPAYQWSVNGVPVTGAGSTYSYMPANGDNITVTMTSNEYCAAPLMVNGSLSVAVSPTVMPSVTVAANPGNIICQGQTVNFAAVPAYGGAAPAYQWVTNGAYSGTDSIYSYLPNDGDIVYCIMTSNYQCRLSNRVSSDNVIMTTQPATLPVVTITANPGNFIPEGASVTLTASVANGGPAPTYQWFVNGDQVYGAIFPSYTSSNFSDMDSVSCEATSSGTCAGIVGFNTVRIHIGNVGVKQITSTGGDIKLMPNPNKGTFTVKGTLATTADEEVTLEITDVLGQVIYNNKVVAHSGTINEKIQLNNVANGMYLLNLRSGTDNKVFHIVIEQ